MTGFFTNSAQAKIFEDDWVQGLVVDQNGEAVIGASIFEKGTQNGTVTDVDGKFRLDVQSYEHTLEISYIGYTTQRIKPKKGDNLHIVLVEDSKTMDEVVVVGYQTMRKTDVVGAVSSIKSKELNVTTPTVGQSLVGKVSGVQIAQVSGAPYQSTKIRVRGVASINASSDPLYVIDGYPSNEDLMLSPEDIESIEVLKDAASAAIYGSRAAGGVVLITTKRGKEGKAKVNYNFQFSVNQLAKKVKLLNSAQFADLVVDGRNNAYKNFMVNAGKAWDDAYFSDTNDVRAQRLGSSNSAAMIPEFLYDFENQRAWPLPVFEWAAAFLHLTIWYICHILKGEECREDFEMGPFVVEFYETRDGQRPAEDFLDELDIKMRSKLVMTLKVLQEQGNRLREPYSKHLDDGIFEIRGKVGTDISRVMYFFYYGGRIILTNGFIKKTQKTPKSEIERAKQYRKDFLEREGESDENTGSVFE